MYTVKHVGFVVLMLSAIIGLSMLQGCSLFQPMGIANYEAVPFEGANGELICCKVTVYNSKDIGMVHVNMTKTADGTSVELYEEAVSATDPYSAAAEKSAENTGKLIDMLQRVP